MSKKLEKKEIYTDHYIVPNTIDARQVKALVYRWLMRLHHKPEQVEKEFYITNLEGVSMPFWIVSCEAHTYWKGLIKEQTLIPLETKT